MWLQVCAGPTISGPVETQVCCQPLGLGKLHHPGPGCRPGVGRSSRPDLGFACDPLWVRHFPSMHLCLENEGPHSSSPSTFQKQCRWSPPHMYPVSKCQMVRDEEECPRWQVGIFSGRNFQYHFTGRIFTPFFLWNGMHLGLCLLPSFPFSNRFQLRKLPYLYSQFPVEDHCYYVVSSGQVK